MKDPFNYLLWMFALLAGFIIYLVFWQLTLAAKNVQAEEYQWADLDTLAVVVSPAERQIAQNDLQRIAHTLAILETNNGKTGVGASLNNLTGIKHNGQYAYFSTPEESIQETMRIWAGYGGMSLESKLAYWKTGNPADRSETTERYIKNFKALVD